MTFNDLLNSVKEMDMIIARQNTVNTRRLADYYNEAYDRYVAVHGHGPMDTVLPGRERSQLDVFFQSCNIAGISNRWSNSIKHEGGNNG